MFFTQQHSVALEPQPVLSSPISRCDSEDLDTVTRTKSPASATSQTDLWVWKMQRLFWNATLMQSWVHDTMCFHLGVWLWMFCTECSSECVVSPEFHHWRWIFKGAVIFWEKRWRHLFYLSSHCLPYCLSHLLEKPQDPLLVQWQQGWQMMEDPLLDESAQPALWTWHIFRLKAAWTPFMPLLIS